MMFIQLFIGYIFLRAVYHMESPIFLEDLMLEFPETISIDPALSTSGDVDSWCVVSDN